MDTLNAVRRTIQRYNLLQTGDTVIAGISGGPDSLCLLHILWKIAPELRLNLHVAHLHHGLRGAEADADAAFVQETAVRWGLACTVECVDVPALAAQPGLSTEEAARNARYAFLGRLAADLNASTLAVGHNADDQAETVLMHWLRGSGMAGLRGMQLINSQLTINHSIIKLVRPLLLVERAEILDYCQKNGLKPRFDRSNEDTTYFRNRLRHELLPLLESYNPQIRRVLQRTATVVGDDYELLHNHLLDAWAGVIRQEGPDQIVFDLAGWRALPSSLQRGLLREAIRRLRRSLRNINFVHIENVLWTLREGATGDRMTLPQGLEAVLGYSRFAIGPTGLSLSGSQFPQLAVARLPLTSPGSIALPSSPWRVETALLAPDDLPAGWQQNTDPWQAWLDADVVGPRPALRIRRPGDRFRPLGLGGKGKGLGEFFTNVKIPTAARDRWPLLVASSDDIAWVCGLRLDERVRITEKTRRVLHLRFSNG